MMLLQRHGTGLCAGDKPHIWLGCLKGPTAHPCLEGPTVARGPRQGRQPFQLLQQPRGKRCTKLGPAQSPGWLRCLPCLCFLQLPLCRWQSPPPAPGVPENSQGPQEGCEIRERQPVLRDDMHAYAQQLLPYKTETSKFSNDFKKCLQVAWASRDQL